MRAEGETCDFFLGGRVALIQPRSGHRAGLDAALLQAAVPDGATGHVVDLGTGAGAVALSVAARTPSVTVTGADLDAEALTQAEAARRLAANVAFADRVAFVLADVTASRRAREAQGLGDGAADWVLMNPPFAEAGRVRASPRPGRRRAHVGTPGALDLWIAAAAGLAKPRGRLAVIHRADALPALLAALAGRFGAVRALPFQPRSGEPASRVLVGAVKGSRAPFRLLPPIVLHRSDGSWTAEAEALLSGRRTLALF